jgi:hypothetical protein
VRLKRLIPLAIVLLGGLFLWRTGGFGFFPVDRTVIFRLPVSYGEVRRLELQIWDDAELLKREEFTYAAGIVGEPTIKVPLGSGTHRAIATATLLHDTTSVGFQREFDPGGDETVVVEFKKP